MVSVFQLSIIDPSYHSHKYRLGNLVEKNRLNIL